MKWFIVAMATGLALAVLAFLTDSWLILLVGGLVLAAASTGAFLFGIRAAQERGFTLPFVVVLGAALGVAALAVAAIVLGSRDDAPGLVLFGSVVIATAITGVLTFGLRSAQRTK